MKKLLVLLFWLGWLGSYAQVSGSLQTQAQDYAFNSVSQHIDIQVITPPLCNGNGIRQCCRPQTTGFYSKLRLTCR